MTTPLLTTKFYTPAIPPGLVARPRLIERLNASLGTCMLTLVSAPAGCGKTTLVSHWLHQREQPSAWLSLDARDNDFARFVNYIVAALQLIDASVGGKLLNDLRSPQPPSPETLATALVNDIAGIAEPFILVLDDYHFILNEEIHELLRFILAHPPPLMHLVLTTRVDPPFPLARLRIRGQITEIRAPDLRFTTREIHAFLNGTMKLGLSGDLIDSLEHCTEGWIAALQLAALSLYEQSDRAAFVANFTGRHRYVTDYLITEVLAQQPEPVQNFLLHTAVLDRMCGPLCDAVLDRPSAPSAALHTALLPSQHMLEYLEQANLFLVPLDDRREWYRYHHLFADLLRLRLERQADLDNSPCPTVLHQRASLWYAGQGLAVEAIHHALAGQDWELAAQQLERFGDDMLYQRGETTLLQRWIETLPTHTIRERIETLRLYLRVLVQTGQVSEAAAKLPDLEQSSDTALHAELSALRGLIAENRAHYDEAVICYCQALEQLPDHASPSRVLVGLRLGRLYFNQGDIDTSQRVLSAAAVQSQTLTTPYLTVAVASFLGQVQMAVGKQRQGVETLRRALSYGVPLNEAVLRLYLSMALYEDNDLEHAQIEVRLAIAAAQRLNFKRLLAAGYCIEGFIHLAHDDSAAAAANVEAIQIIAADMPSNDYFVGPHLDALQVRLWIANGDRDALEEWVAMASHRIATIDWMNYSMVQRSIHTLAFAEIAIGAGHAAVERLQPALAAARARGSQVVELLATLATAHAVAGDSICALATLAEALEWAEPEHYIRTFVDLGAVMHQLLQRLASQGCPSAYLCQLLTAFSANTLPHAWVLPSPAPSPPLHYPTHQALVMEPLTSRELAILRLLAADRSNQQIANQLHLALSTVKWYTHTIYSKMGVRKRSQAVARARAAGLL